MWNRETDRPSDGEPARFGPLKSLVLAVLVAILCASCGGGGGGGNPASAVIRPALVASRTTGVAPLAVFFDATGTTSAATSKPFHDIEYRWDFGDPASGTWGFGSKATTSSRNAATGPVASHVFETLGAHNVTLMAFDGTNTATRTIQIVVSDPGTVFAGPTNTICVSSTGVFTGCPSGGSTMTQSDFHTALSNSLGIGKRRILFRRGETFTTSVTTVVADTGPGIIGAFGTGAKPIVNATVSAIPNGMIAFGDQSSPNSSADLKDWRVMDISFDGNGNSEVLAHNGGFDQLTYLRVDATHCGDACVMFNGGILDSLNTDVDPNHHTHRIWTDIAIADCTISNPSTWSLYLWAKNFALLGNSFDNLGAGSHTVRIVAGVNGVVSNNLFAHNGTTGTGNHALKFHAPPVGTSTLFSGVSYSENVVISDNKFVPSNSALNNWTVSIEPEDTVKDERLRNVIFERNWLTAGTQTVIGVTLQATEATLRNNFFDGTGATAGIFTQIIRRSTVAPAPNNVWIYNNTLFSSSANVNTISQPFMLIDVSATHGGVTIKNNLGYAPAVGSASMIVDSAASIISNNTTNAQTVVNPNFVSLVTSNLANFKIQNTSYARNAGTTVPVLSDFFGVARPQGAAIDLGFAEIP